MPSPGRRTGTPPLDGAGALDGRWIKVAAGAGGAFVRAPRVPCTVRELWIRAWPLVWQTLRVGWVVALITVFAYLGLESGFEHRLGHPGQQPAWPDELDPFGSGRVDELLGELLLVDPIRSDTTAVVSVMASFFRAGLGVSDPLHRRSRSDSPGQRAEYLASG